MDSDSEDPDATPREKDEELAQSEPVDTKSKGKPALVQKGRLIRKNNEVKVYPSNRSSASVLVKFVECLSEERRRCVQEIGFGGMFQFGLKRNRNMQLVDLMKSFDDGLQKLIVHGTKLPLTEEMVNQILGIPRGSQHIRMKGSRDRKRKRVEDATNVDNVKTRKRRKDIVDELTGALDEEDCRAKFLFLAHQNVLCPTTSVHCQESSNIFKDLVQDVKEMNWCELVMDGPCNGVKDLKQNLVDFEGQNKTSLWLKGCTMLLEIFYVENIDCEVITTPWSKRTTPWVLDCTDDKIQKVYVKVKDFDNINVSNP